MQVRDELEGFLKDDDDISKMCLTRKLELSRPETAVTGTRLKHPGQLALLT